MWQTGKPIIVADDLKAPDGVDLDVFRDGKSAKRK